MSKQAEIERLRFELQMLQNKSRRSGWLLRQLGSKIVSFPNDLVYRIRRSREKRAGIKSARAAPRQFFQQGREWNVRLKRLTRSDLPAGQMLREMRDFQSSEELNDILRDAIALDPNIASVDLSAPGYVPPWFDDPYEGFTRVLDALPKGQFENLILVPFGKMGGADYVAGILSRVVGAQGKTLILRTEQSDWARPEWYSDDVQSVDISEGLADIPDRARGLFCAIQTLGAKRIYNVNSRACFDMLASYGKTLAKTSELYAYYFCSDYTAEGHEAGYPVWYMTDVLPHLTAALCDTEYLRNRLIERYQIPEGASENIKSIYTPFAEKKRDEPLVDAQIASASGRSRPLILWAGRLDRQKRFDLVLEIASAMPHVDFRAWGAAVLDAPPRHTAFPPNLTLHDPFTSYADLPLENCEGWLYTAGWDGLPTILIEIAGMGMPVVASAVGGVPELINNATGWSVTDVESVPAYAAALEEMIADPEARRRRAHAAYDLVMTRHSAESYVARLGDGGVS